MRRFMGVQRSPIVRVCEGSKGMRLGTVHNYMCHAYAYAHAHTHMMHVYTYSCRVYDCLTVHMGANLLLLMINVPLV